MESPSFIRSVNGNFRKAKSNCGPDAFLSPCRFSGAIFSHAVIATEEEDEAKVEEETVEASKTKRKKG